MTNSRQKGARFERTLAAELRGYGYERGRGQQCCGTNGDADLIGIPGIHIEAKHQERMSRYGGMEQAKREARQDELRAVWHKKNNAEILVSMELADWIKLYREWEAGQ